MSFKWLSETFLSAMLGKQPRTIFTNQFATMANAIEDVFPESNHGIDVKGSAKSQCESVSLI